jgi:hypothetical protein
VLLNSANYLVTSLEVYACFFVIYCHNYIYFFLLISEMSCVIGVG